MAASDYDFLLTLNEIAEQAYRKIGVLPQGETMSGEQRSDAKIRINLIVKEWESDQVFLWRRFRSDVALVAAQSEYAFPTGGSDPEVETVDAALVRVDDQEIELEYFSYRKFQEISDKDAPGRPQIFTIDHKQRLVKTWPVATETDTLVLYCVAKLADWDDEDESGDFPGRWQRALFYALVCDLLEDYPSSSLSFTRMEQKAATLYMRARRMESDNSDEEFIKGCY